MSKEDAKELVESYLEAQGIMPATANKAAEEGELPALPEPEKKVTEGPGYKFTSVAFSDKHMREYALQAIAADRASRQVANKAEVEPVVIEVLQLALHALRKAPELRALGFNELHASDCTDGIDSTGCTTKDYANAAEDVHAVIERASEAVRGLLATPPATTGASTARDDDFAKIVRSSCGKQVLFFKEASEDEGNTLHIVMTSNEAHFDMKMKGIPDEHFKSSLDKADQKMADQAIARIKELGFGEEE